MKLELAFSCILLILRNTNKSGNTLALECNKFGSQLVLKPPSGRTQNWAGHRAATLRSSIHSLIHRSEAQFVDLKFDL